MFSARSAVIVAKNEQTAQNGTLIAGRKLKIVRMKKTKEQIIKLFDAHLQVSDQKSYGAFYIGITNDIERRVFGEHNVDKTEGAAWWIYDTAIDKATAQAVEEYYLEKGMKGDTGGGTDDSIYVYCYEITSTTIE